MPGYRISRVIRIGLMLCVAGGLSSISTPAHADDAAKPVPAAAPGAAKPAGSAGAQAQKMAEMNNKVADTLASRYASATGKVKEAADALVAAIRAQSAAQVQLGEAADAGDREKVKALAAEMSEMSKKNSRLHDVLEGREDEASLSDAKRLETLKKVAAGAPTEYEAAVAAYKRAAAAAANLAEVAGKADATQEAVEDARDAMVAAQNEVRLAQWIASSTAEVAMRAAVPQRANTPEFNKSIDQLKELNKEYAEAMRKDLDAQLAMRKIERERRQAATAADLAQRAAMAAPKK